MTTRDRYVDAYRRACALEQRMSDRLRKAILVRYFGGCTCRLHNCIVAFEYGQDEGPSHGLSHHELVKLARRFNHQQRVIWDTTNRLRTAFARHI